MPGHRRGKSLSDAITLELSEEGSRLISSINTQRLEKGDEVSGEQFDDRVPVLTRSNLSKSLDNLDQLSSPKTMLKDSYNKLYNAKIKRFMKEDLRGADESRENVKLTAGGLSKVGLKHDMDLPRLGVDFGLMKTKRRQTSESEDDADSESDDTTLTYGSNLNLPPLGLGSGRAARSGTQEPRWNLNTDRPSVDLSLPNIERPQIGLEGKGTFEAPKFNLPDLGLSGPSLSGTDYKLETPDINIPDVTSRKINVKHSKKLKKPNLNVDDFSGYVESPKFSLSGRSP
ncbi:unnamed protein product [Pleuronectes platessa]|uniref:Uncharacterized protein n=1 Tax=Pleuronectes platessa TaxID=8262 RepID=A0A9N7VYE2_PLEPL|nr:unnamed protein product [Pleuronectes platessa]